jgi:quaternary ammonium compound-resistance protein SugE
MISWDSEPRQAAGLRLHRIDTHGGLRMAWTLLFAAGLFEIAWAIGLKYTDGFTRLVPSALTLIAMTISVVLLAVALRAIPVGTGYAVWTGIGAVGTALLGIVLFGESASVARLGCIGLIVAGIAGLKIVSG